LAGWRASPGMISSGEPPEDAAGPGARLDGDLRWHTEYAICVDEPASGFLVASGDGRTAVCIPAVAGEYRSRSQAWSITVEHHGFGWRLVAQPRRDSQVAATAQPRVRPSAYTSSRSRTSRPEPRDRQVGPVDHQSRAPLSGTARQRGEPAREYIPYQKLTPFCHFTAVTSRADTRLGLATGLTTWGQRRGRRSVEESRARLPLYTDGALASGRSAARARGSVPRWVGSAWLPRDRRDGSRLSAALLMLESRLRRCVIHGFGTR
jgi:hypothetical protein